MSTPVIPPARETGALAAEVPRPSRLTKWHRRLLSICLIVFALELGVFLVIFPWRSEWDLNWVAVHSRQWSDVWMNYYFRGAISGLGLLNIYVAGGEFLRQVKLLLDKGRQNAQTAAGSQAASTKTSGMGPS